MFSPVCQRAPTATRFAEADVPTEYGVFRVVVYREPGSPFEHCAIVKGDVAGQSDVLVRVHSECLTGEVLRSLKCDCREQLELALERIAEQGSGAVLYLRQEGRGIGLGNKIRAYALQERGLDTVDANRALGFDDDLRRYHVATTMLADLGVRSVALMTNNPAKVEALIEDGVVVSRRVDHYIEPHEHNESYLTTKRARMGHLFEGSACSEYGEGGNGNGKGNGASAIAPTLLAVANDDAE
ncbi:MAG: GTP cyclohydrolase II [Polyangiales bacterium]